jgi:hypothetical protein
MADLQKILNTFSKLGIENKGLVPDDPMQQGRALKEQYGNNNTTDPNAHARMVAESIKGTHIPGVSDTSASDMAALAGVGTPTQRPQPANPNPNSMHIATPTSDRWAEFDSRLSNIENKLNSIFESIQKITEISDSDYNAKRKAIFDLEMNPALQDKETKDAIKKRKAQLEKERKETTKESLEKGFASFLKELEGK